MIGRCKVVAIEGSHGTGKTTLAHGVAATLSAKGYPVTMVGEVVRSSSWFQEALLRGDGTLEVDGFIHLFADQLRQEMEATIQSAFAVLDRTVLSCLGYWNLRVRSPRRTGQIREALEQVARLHAARYDVLVYSRDMYPLEDGQDVFRETDETFRMRSDRAIRACISRIGLRPIDIPRGFGVGEKIEWVVGRLDGTGINGWE